MYVTTAPANFHSNKGAFNLLVLNKLRENRFFNNKLTAGTRCIPTLNIPAADNRTRSSSICTKEAIVYNFIKTQCLFIFLQYYKIQSMNIRKDAHRNFFGQRLRQSGRGYCGNFLAEKTNLPSATQKVRYD